MFILIDCTDPISWYRPGLPGHKPESADPALCCISDLGSWRESRTPAKKKPIDQAAKAKKQSIPDPSPEPKSSVCSIVPHKLHPVARIHRTKLNNEPFQPQ